jgi:alkanesulfonate monooxygenase SsuD/methylene tetrahydromethanopterin reductase-like flavin-dependent oxidoreductase (luciferase family)
MELGLMTEPQLGMTYDELLAAARFAERQGLAVFARSDHYAFPRVEGPHATDAFATLGGLARETSDIELCVMVSPIMFRHPAVLAKMAATIDEMSGGRLLLGVGTGWMEEEHEKFGFHFGTWGERFDRLEEALGYLHAAFGRSEGGFSGEHYTLREEDVRPLPTGPLPIVIGGSGKKRTPRLAGTYAGEFNAFLGDGPEDLRSRIETAKQEAEKAGRDPDDLKISVMGATIAAPDEASFRAMVDRMAAADPFGRDADAIVERYRQRGLPCGPGDQARQALADFAEAGVDRFYVQHFGPFDEDLLAEIFETLRG